MITSFKTEQLGIGFDFDIDLEFDKKIYCFIGKNGIGKTQLLESMAKSLIFTHSIFSQSDGKLKYAGLFLRNTIYNKLKAKSLKLLPDIELNGSKIKDKNIQKWGFTDFEHIGANRNNTFVCDKPIVFVGAKNRGFAKNIDSNNIKILSDSQNRFVDSFERTMRYINGEGLDHQEIADWFASRLIINPSFVAKNQNREQEAVTVLQLIDRLEPGLNLVTQNETGGISLNLIFSEGQLLINGTPLDKLSTGYISIIKIFQEIVAGYSGWTNESNLNEVDGIVFIDEIEPHLHISWQTKIIAVLREFFPNTTFFISTHSPLVLSGLKNGEGYELVRDGDFVKTKTIDNIENYFLNDIVKEFFGVDLNKEKIAHVDKAKQNKAKKLLLDLAKTLQEEGQ
ncbi:MAG: ATP-binding protein [Methylobacter sp.]|nr:MAG: ATP-binding protein [Methylobacter sp.]